MAKVELDNVPEAIRNHINQLEQVRKDFVANVSHELRTPLTVIRGYLESLLKKNKPEAKVFHDIFKQMHQHSIRMENIIDDLLLLSRLESEGETINTNQRVVVKSLLDSICRDAKDYALDKQHSILLEADPNLGLLGSEEELKSVFTNLIINAVKYTPAKGNILVKWYHDETHAVFSVKDNGIGISDKDIPRITERFYCVDKARSRERGGTGLGLAIVKHVMMQHQGEMQIQSKLGKGSEFSCLFPHVRIFKINTTKNTP